MLHLCFFQSLIERNSVETTGVAFCIYNSVGIWPCNSIPKVIRKNAWKQDWSSNFHDNSSRKALWNIP